MKYFTKEWHGGGWNGYQLEQTRDAYFQRLEALRLDFPGPVAELATHVDLQSGLIKKVRYLNRRPRALQLSLRCGNVFRGYQDLELNYRDVAVSDEDLLSLELLADVEKVEMLADEVDVGPPGRYVHRILFSDYDDIEIGFQSVTINRENTLSRSFTKDPLPFVVISGRHS